MYVGITYECSVGLGFSHSPLVVYCAFSKLVSVNWFWTCIMCPLSIRWQCSHMYAV
ncbi:hypothetical protein DPEC_G00211330 [Dallia pectoralis]|uniref:Uncharacterized protein n=1 Tax=Dallia pectoralis TaxID=75939 RepID=A0ACC2G671_DALPE|nr:hypothetical protein DPEC_G00211330 [Dallia pectoralis]